MLQSQSHATYLNLILYFEHKSELESENKPAILQFVSAFTEFVAIMHVQRSEIIFFLLCLPGSQNKFKIIPNREITVFKDVRKDTDNRHG